MVKTELLKIISARRTGSGLGRARGVGLEMLMTVLGFPAQNSSHLLARRSCSWEASTPRLNSTVNIPDILGPAPLCLQ
ncbi:unnamed protein product [Gulo gulo]|uniref:Uncharacterized protein n=1 Tax=Gulo gulo TaxID=48420 RepID=A0A9X9MB54_GULGU|nr:unnamed protein product [Gulo gulo]